MGFSLEDRQYKIAIISLFVVSLAFTGTMLGLIQVYWNQRVHTCYVIPDPAYDDCETKIHDYLFDGYRNIVNEYIIDWIQLLFNLICVVTIGLLYKKVPKAVNYILLLIVLACSLWALANGYRSIDEEDTLDAHAEARKQSVQAQLDAASPACSDLPATLTATQTKLDTAKAQLTALLNSSGYQSNPNSTANLTAYTTLTTGITQLTAGIAKIQAGIVSCEVGAEVVSNLQDLHDKYRNYRHSVMALVIINFVAIYNIGFIFIFIAPQETELQVKRQELVTVSNNINYNEQAILKNATSNETDANAM